MALTKEQQLFQRVIKEAWSNDMFKTALLEDPIKAIEGLTGKQLKLPQGKTLVVKDQSHVNTLFINIPTEPHMDDMELNKEQLEIIAAGGIPSKGVLADPSEVFKYVN